MPSTHRACCCGFALPPPCEFATCPKCLSVTFANIETCEPLVVVLGGFSRNCSYILRPDNFSINAKWSLAYIQGSYRCIYRAYSDEFVYMEATADCHSQHPQTINGRLALLVMTNGADILAVVAYIVPIPYTNAREITGLTDTQFRLKFSTTLFRMSAIDADPPTYTVGSVIPNVAFQCGGQGSGIGAGSGFYTGFGGTATVTLDGSCAACSDFDCVLSIAGITKCTAVCDDVVDGTVKSKRVNSISAPAGNFNLGAWTDNGDGTCSATGTGPDFDFAFDWDAFISADDCTSTEFEVKNGAGVCNGSTTIYQASVTIDINTLQILQVEWSQECGAYQGYVFFYCYACQAGQTTEPKHYIGGNIPNGHPEGCDGQVAGTLLLSELGAAQVRFIDPSDGSLLPCPDDE